MPPTRGFRAALAGRDRLGVISEIKRRSPSKGELHPGLDPAAIARAYQRGGAACLSVLTDEEFFGGSAADLSAARAACSLPVLRKDFTVSSHDVADARLMGADCLLLIAAAMSPQQLAELHALALDLGLDVLVEIHDEAELEHAMAADATLVGVNQRDLVTFQVDHERALRMAACDPRRCRQSSRIGCARWRGWACAARRRLSRRAGRRDPGDLQRSRRRRRRSDRRVSTVQTVARISPAGRYGS